MIRDLPRDERPRERFEKYGAGGVSNAELIAILLRTGTARESALRLAERLLSEFGNLRNLGAAEVEELQRVKGIGPAKAVELKAAMELGKRLCVYADADKPTIRTASDVVNLLRSDMQFLPREEFRVLLLNTKNQVLAIKTVTAGTLNASLVHPREVFREAISRNSHALICAHNHPSGDPSPSAEDISVTRRLVEAGNLIDIQVLDHVIIGSDQRSVSLREKGLM